MSVLLDTNVLLRLTQRNSPHHPLARQAVLSLRRDGELLYTVPQNLIEYWAVATRPAENNGLDLSIKETQREIRKFKRLFRSLDDGSGVSARWEALVAHHSVIGKNVHDAHLIAAMLKHGITHLLTFNGADFKRFNEITVIDPTQKFVS